MNVSISVKWNPDKSYDWVKLKILLEKLTKIADETADETKDLKTVHLGRDTWFYIKLEGEIKA